MTYSSTRDPEIERCIEECNRCHDLCLSTAMRQGLDMSGKHIEEEHFRLMINCSDLCHTAANFMLSGSSLHGAVCAACAEVCDVCARSCERIGDMDECMEACRRCAESCEDMSKSYEYRMGQLPASDVAGMAHA